MKLVSFIVQNFRCYERPFKTELEDFTALIGRNDIGKSALLEALSIFFEQSKIDRHDASVNGDPTNVRITCEFSDLPESLVLDADNPTTLANEFLLNSEGNLEITKTYDATLGTPKVTSVTATALHPTAENFADLLSLKRTELIKRAKALEVDTENVNKAVNAELRAAIWGFSDDLQLAVSKVDLQKEAGKQAWHTLNKYLPTFWLFKSDRASTDQDAEAQDPLNAAIAQAVKAIEGELETITDRVREEVTKVALLTVEKIAEMDPDLSSTLDPVVKTRKWESLFQTSVTGENGIPLNKRGSGVRRLVLLNFFRAQVEAAASEENASVIYAIEEPETSQHPRNQRLLLSTLQRLTSDPTRQVLITTHTPMLARAVPENKIRFIHDNGPHRAIAHGGNELNRDIANALGVLADHSVKAFIGVEGPNDIAFLTEISKVLFREEKTKIELEKLESQGEVIFIPLGGSCLALWADRLQALNKPEFHICDRDNPMDQQPNYANFVETINARDNCIAHHTNKREMENYIHPRAIEEAYRENGLTVNLPENFQDFDDVPLLVAQCVHRSQSDTTWNDLSIEKQKKKISKAKKTINAEAVRHMTIERLQESGSLDEVVGWFEDLSGLVEVEA